MTEKGTEHGDFEEIVQVRKWADHCVMTKRSSGLEPIGLRRENRLSSGELIRRKVRW